MKKRTRIAHPISPKPREAVEPANDIDYWNKLNKAELEWLRKFEKEYYFAKDLKKETALHKTKQQRTAVTQMHRSSRNCITPQYRNSPPTAHSSDVEDSLIAYIDSKNESEE